MSVPVYLRKRENQNDIRFINDAMDCYRPLWGAWLIEIALMFELYNQNRHASRGRMPDIFEDESFCGLTGLGIDTLVGGLYKTTAKRKKSQRWQRNTTTYFLSVQSYTQEATQRNP